MANRPPLANAELAVMDHLWRGAALTARDLRERLYPDASRAQHGTVQRLLQRLEQKDYVRRDRSQGVHRFEATLSRERYAAHQIELLADKLTGGAVAPLLTHLVREKHIPKAELARLRALLDDLDEEAS